mmetsp:Transcript_17803/g.36840  ORF Transcript_17803/g.36840 Transcript_17803/m.36840 type:complete len:111 (-) Transcript_17803:692-1024(-)
MVIVGQSWVLPQRHLPGEHSKVITPSTGDPIPACLEVTRTALRVFLQSSAGLIRIPTFFGPTVLEVTPAIRHVHWPGPHPVTVSDIADVQQKVFTIPTWFLLTSLYSSLS